MQTDERRLQQAMGVMYGQAYGDAFGMPGELWTQRQIAQALGEIDRLLPGHPDNPASHLFCAGQVTDDTQMACAIAHALIEDHNKQEAGVLYRLATEKAALVDELNCLLYELGDRVACHLIDWADREQVWDKNILGPSSARALQAVKQGDAVAALHNDGRTNGAVMRIAPIGCIYPLQPWTPNSSLDEIGDMLGELYALVFAVSSPTHKSDIALSGAAGVAAFLSAALAGLGPGACVQAARAATRRVQGVVNRRISPCNSYEAVLAREGIETFSPNLEQRIVWALDLIDTAERQYGHAAFNLSHAATQAVLDICAQTIGCGMDVIETVPCAFAIARAARFDPMLAAYLSAQAGGDTDTIGALATSMCAALRGVRAIPSHLCELLDEVNQMDIAHISTALDGIRQDMAAVRDGGERGVER